jgi:hypothetical protein
MRFLITTALMVLMVLVPQAHAGLTILPTDDTGGGGSGDIHWFMHFGSNAPGWPSVNSCLSAQAGAGAHRTCAATTAPGSRNVKPYFGTPFVRYLACTPSEDHTSWGSSASFSVSVFSVQGSDVEGNYVRTQVGSGGLEFDETDGAGVTKRLTINLPVPISNAQIQIKFSTVSAPPSAPADNGLICVVALAE